MPRRLVTAVCALVVAAAAQLLYERPAAAVSCSFNTNLGAGVDFGSYDPLAGTTLTTVWTLAWTCPAGQNGYTVTMSPGNSGVQGTRWMVDSISEQLNYNLYLDPLMTTIWGDGTNGTQILTGAASSQTAYSQNVYAKLPGKQNVTAYQSFSDYVTATLNF